MAELEKLPEGAGQQMPGAVVPTAVPPSVLLASQRVRVEREITLEASKPERKEPAEKPSPVELPSRHNNYNKGFPAEPEPKPAPERSTSMWSAGNRQAKTMELSDQGLPPDDLEKLQMHLYPSLTTKSSRGGRKVASDPRLDPSISPKRAARILANRLSAARSKKRQREGLALAKERDGMEVAQLLVNMHAGGGEDDDDGDMPGASATLPVPTQEMGTRQSKRITANAALAKRGQATAPVVRNGHSVSQFSTQRPAGSRLPSSSAEQVPYKAPSHGGGGQFVHHSGLNPGRSHYFPGAFGPSYPPGIPPRELAMMHGAVHPGMLPPVYGLPPSYDAGGVPQRPQDPKRFKDVSEKMFADNAILSAKAIEGDAGHDAGHAYVFGKAPEASGEVRHYPSYSSIATKISMSQKQTCLVAGLALQRVDEEAPMPCEIPHVPGGAGLPPGYPGFGMARPPPQGFDLYRMGEEAHVRGLRERMLRHQGLAPAALLDQGPYVRSPVRPVGNRNRDPDDWRAPPGPSDPLTGQPLRQDQLMLAALQRNQSERAVEKMVAEEEGELSRRRLQELMRHHQQKQMERQKEARRPGVQVSAPPGAGTRAEADQGARAQQSPGGEPKDAQPPQEGPATNGADVGGSDDSVDDPRSVKRQAIGTGAREGDVPMAMAAPVELDVEPTTKHRSAATAANDEPAAVVLVGLGDGSHQGAPKHMEGEPLTVKFE